MSEGTALHPNPTKRFKGPNDRQRKLAEGVIRDGKSFRQAAVDAGYSPKTAALGPSFNRRASIGVDMAFVEAAKNQVWQPEEVKATIRARLLSDISRGRSSGVAREAELLGKEKTVDMFVRTGDVQIGIFAGVEEKDVAELAAIIDVPATDPTDK